MIWQKTIAHPIKITGIGLHSGQPVTMSMYPATANQGLKFIRTDLPDRPQVRAHFSRVVDTTRATTLGEGPATLATVEHLLAAFYGMGIDNAAIEVDGPEIPIMDGSAKPFVDLLTEAGFTSLPWPKAYLVVHKQVELSNGDGWIRVVPGQAPHHVRHRLSPPADQAAALHRGLGQRAFPRGNRPGPDLRVLKRSPVPAIPGTGRGGSLDNALVLDDTGVMNPGGLRYPEEFVRHKILDVLGDLALLGMPVLDAWR